MTVSPSGKVSTPQGIAGLSQTERTFADSLAGDDLGVIFPEKPIRVGESWSYKHQVNTLQGPFTLDTKCKLASIETKGGARYARIDCERNATILGDHAGNRKKRNEPQNTLKIKSTIAFAIDQGFLQEVEFEIVQIADGAGKGPSVEIKISGKLEKKQF